MTEKFLPRLAVWLLVFQAVLRLTTSGDSAVDGTNLLIHLLAFMVIAVILTSKVLRRDDEFAWSGLEIPLFLFLVAVLLSPVIAGHKMPAVWRSVALTAFAALFVGVVSLRRDLSEVVRRMILPTLLIVAIYSLMQFSFFFEMTRKDVADDPSKISIGAEFLREFAERLGSNEVFGTFVLSNTLAGFLVLLIPFVVGMVIDLFRDVRTRDSFPVLRAVALLVLGALASLTLALTGSLGGWVALAAATLVFAGGWCIHRCARGTWIALSAVVLLTIGAIVASPAAMESSKSLRIRSVYWDGAVRVALDHPVTGVGLGNFGDHYYAVKGPEQEETIHAHNDYLQTWAELGIVGVLPLLCFCVMLVIGGLRRIDRMSEAVETVPHPRWLMGSSAFAAIMLSYGLEGTFGDVDGGPTLALVFGTVWVGYDLLIGRSPLPCGFFTRAGMLAGIAGFLTHMAVDFDFAVFGTAESFFLIAAAFCVLLGGVGGRVRIGRTASGVITVAVWAIIALLGLFLYPSVDAGDRAMRRGERVYAEAWKNGVNPSKLKEAEEWYLRAIAEKPMAIDGHARLGMVFHDRWRILSADRAKWREHLKSLEEAMTASVMAMENAIRINPREAGLRATLGEFHRLYAGFYTLLVREEGASSSLRTAEARDHLRKAEDLFAEAVRLYPTRAWYRERYGVLLWTAEKYDEARVQFRAALEYHGWAEANGVKRLQLDERTVAELRNRL